LVDLGVDSLVGVEIRTWCLGAIGVELPVLKILGGASIADLVFDVMERIQQDALSKSTSRSENDLEGSTSDLASGAGLETSISAAELALSSSTVYSKDLSK
jgi:hypothetical protein